MEYDIDQFGVLGRSSVKTSLLMHTVNIASKNYNHCFSWSKNILGEYGAHLKCGNNHFSSCSTKKQ